MRKSARNCRQRAPKPSGFTLVEVLIVLCILGILATLLLPVFGRAREGARAVTCASNLWTR